jgi:hypothetical protein
MSGARKESLTTTESEASEEVGEEREVFLRDGRRLTVSDAGADQLVEVRSASGLVEVRIRLTEQGPVLQMESVRLQLKASESIELESERVAIRGTESVAVRGGAITVEAEDDATVTAEGEVRVRGKMIHLN